MKRSDMLLTIVSVLNNLPSSVVNSYKADCILTAIEEAGMLPPKSKTIGHGSLAEEVYEWEPENE